MPSKLKTIVTRTAALSIAAFTVGCMDGAPAVTSPDDASEARASRSAEQCQNVLVEGDASLGLFEVAPNVFTLIAIPFDATIAGVDGKLGSIVTGLQFSGSKNQGAQHLTLVHNFVSDEGTFTTTDQAVCAPAGKNVTTCRVNDVLSVVSGTGVFANAAGKLTNHGTINLSTFSLAISLRGRVCGDGL